MRELDLVLEAFLESHYDRLTPEAQAAFEHLLARSNDDLLDWLMGSAEPANAALARIAAQIREVQIVTARARPVP